MTKIESIKRAGLTRFAELVQSRKTETIIMLMLAGFLAAIGFLTGDVTNENYKLLYEFGSQYFWGTLFLVYSGIKAFSLFVTTNYWVKMANGIVGLWAWLYIFLSFTVFDKTALAPTEVLLAMPVLVQSWLTLSTVYWGRK